MRKEIEEKEGERGKDARARQPDKQSSTYRKKE